MSDFHPASVSASTDFLKMKLTVDRQWNPAWSVATMSVSLPLCNALNTCSQSPPFRLTGLLSFMMSDEITTGSVNTTDADKRTWARKSHPWNIQQRKFKEAFPEVCHT